MDNKKALSLVVAIATLNVPVGTWILHLQNPKLMLGLSSDFWAGAFLSADVGIMWLLIYFFYQKSLLQNVNGQNSTQLQQGPAPTHSHPTIQMNEPRKKDGYWFYFNYDDVEIAVHRSTLLGNETVFFNDNPVSELNNIFGLKRSHNILYQGKKFKVVTEFVDLVGYKLECLLYVDRKKHSRETKGLIIGGAKDAFTQLCMTIAIGAGCGIIIGLFVYIGFFLFGNVLG